ncbi:MAG: transporter [Myxococcota bacterium]
MDRGRLRFGASMLYSYINAAHDVDPEQFEPGIPFEDQAAEHQLGINMLEWDVDAQFGVHRRFAFELMLPIRTTIIDASFADAQGRPLPNFQSIHHRDEVIAGVGDLTFGGRIGLVLPENVPRWTLALRTGVSLPTGNTEPDPFALGAAGQEHQHMFFGSGTVDPRIGFDTNVAFDRWGLVGWSLLEAPLYSNKHGYRGSTVVVGGMGAQSGFGLQRWSFLVQPEVYFETPARWNDTLARNSGRTSLIATAGAFFLPTPQWRLHALVKVPYATFARGGQLRWPIVALLGFSYTVQVGKPERDGHHHG